MADLPDAEDLTIDWWGAHMAAVQWEGQDIIHIGIDMHEGIARVTVFDSTSQNAATLTDPMEPFTVDLRGHEGERGSEE